MVKTKMFQKAKTNMLEIHKNTENLRKEIEGVKN
jgi:hypothetical protein